MAFFSVGWAAFDDFELVADDKDEECVIKPPEAVPHIPSLGDCTFQVIIYKIKRIRYVNILNDIIGFSQQCFAVI